MFDAEVSFFPPGVRCRPLTRRCCLESGDVSKAMMNEKCICRDASRSRHGAVISPKKTMMQRQERQLTHEDYVETSCSAARPRSCPQEGANRRASKRENHKCLTQDGRLKEEKKGKASPCKILVPTRLVARKSDESEADRKQTRKIPF